jgi:hypothetical protein
MLMRSTLRHRRLVATMALSLAGLVAAPVAVARGGHDGQWAGDRDLRITTLSTNPRTVSGGDVLVRVDVPRGMSLRGVRVDLNGRDVTRMLEPDGGALSGLVTGLRLGRNRLEAAVGRHADRLTVTNHPITGPVFSGPQQQPFICETQNFILPALDTTLGPPLDAKCSIGTRVDYVYKSTDGTFKPLADPNARPPDLARTTTTLGRTVNYVVRMETGTINRAIYQTAILHDPNVDPPTSARTPSGGWNGRLVYSFGGGCRAGYHQGTTTGQPTGGSSGVLEERFSEPADGVLAKGYAVAVSSLNVYGTKCDDVVNAETMMMVKERFIERYGVPRHTIGKGVSGGSMQQHLIAHNYPGLLDGITPGLSFPDALTFSIPYMDCGLLDNAFNASTLGWTVAQKAAVIGHRTYEYCARNTTWWYRMVQPDTQCDPVIPEALIYDAATNPGGVRCTLADDMVNVYGYDPETGFGRRPFDNVGIQYGLKAFNDGQITAQQFIDLNARVGGYDIDGNIVSDRMVADHRALRIAYRTGRITSGRGLASVPIIDHRAYLDQIGDVHDAVRSRIMRARLIADNGHANNQVILTVPGETAADSGAIALESIGLMDRWLENIANDRSRRSQAEKVARNKPPELVDACYTAEGEKITDAETCDELYPPQRNPRLAAGEPLTNDVLKCRLKRIDRSDYEHGLTREEWAQLKAIFPDGVCDYGRPGVAQGELEDTWYAYPRPGRSVRLQVGEPDDHRDTYAAALR